MILVVICILEFSGETELTELIYNYMRDSVTLTNMTRGWAIPRCCLQAWAPGNCKLPTPGHWNIKSERDQHEAEYIDDPKSLGKSYRKDTIAWTQMSIRESNRHMLPKEGSNLGERFPSLLWFYYTWEPFWCHQCISIFSRNNISTYLKIYLTTFQSKNKMLNACQWGKQN